MKRLFCKIMYMMCGVLVLIVEAVYVHGMYDNFLTFDLIFPQLLLYILFSFRSGPQV